MSHKNRYVLFREVIRQRETFFLLKAKPCRQNLLRLARNDQFQPGGSVERESGSYVGKFESFESRKSAFCDLYYVEGWNAVD